MTADQGNLGDRKAVFKEAGHRLMPQAMQPEVAQARLCPKPLPSKIHSVLMHREHLIPIAFPRCQHGNSARREEYDARVTILGDRQFDRAPLEVHMAPTERQKFTTPCVSCDNAGF